MTSVNLAASPRRHAVACSFLVLAGVAGAVGMRTGMAGGPGPASTPAALAFATTLAGLAGAAGWRPSRPQLRPVVAGAAGGAALVAAVALRSGIPPLHAGGIPLGALVGWAPAVTLVALGEEAVLRGVLFDSLSLATGPRGALVITSLAFAIIHIPLYGIAALPLDLVVGVWLGGLRLVTGGIAAPATAHVLADLASGWV